ncbi:spondin domain-containing protein [Alteromonas sp. 1_MG-2023]|uniref:spondin domain-containing protein n=1 Tax=Alteromonas sp. 1_MG-2023 TaxID=3062669 RepID=UPI0026E23AD1|nr:spondin domain-containing protein [Alteromonas sp. 1_MG-2023]MDO6569082.1 spondin domain-containing protein [Alteromonas sp. 1_MG-2023]
MKRLNKISAAALLAFASQQSFAADITVEIQNLSHGIYITPIAAVAHTTDASLFEVGEAASTEIQMLAEGGNLDGITTIGTSIGADMIVNPAGGLLAPGMTTSADLMTTGDNTVLSVVAMIVPSNDAFIGLDNWEIPADAGTYTVYVNAYDAGTEANDEIRGGGEPGTPGMPVPPPLEDMVGTGGSGVAGADTNAAVHIHRGTIGDDSLTDGASDLNNTVHRWLNPVAKVTVTVR